MKKKLFLLVSIIFLYFNSLTAVTYNSEPKIFIQELVNDAIKTLSDKSLTLEEKNIVIEKIVIENVDVKGLGFYTLGQIRKDLDENTLNTYQDLFQDYFLKSLFSRLNDYSSQKFEVLEAEQKNANYTIVRSKVAESIKSPEIKIDWRIYKKPAKTINKDLIVEGLSLARTQKEEFASILNSNSNDINALLKRLQEFISN